MSLFGATDTAAAPAPEVDPFYSDLLRSGTAAFSRGDFEGASRRLRVAAFGLLDAPEKLAEALVKFSVAQAELGDREGFAETFGRIAEVEDLFTAYSRAAIADDLRSAFEARIVDWIAPATLRGSSTFGQLLRRQEMRRLNSMQGAQRLAELERLAARNPDDPSWRLLLGEELVAAGRGGGAVDLFEQLSTALPTNRSASCLLQRAYLQSGQCASFETLLGCRIRTLPEPELATLIDCLTTSQRWLDAGSILVSLPPEVRGRRALTKREKRVSRNLPSDTEVPLLPTTSVEPETTAPVAPVAPVLTSPSPSTSNSTVDPADLLALRSDLDRARTLVELETVATRAEGLAERFPQSVEPRYLAGEAAYRASNWQRAANNLSGAEALPRERPELLFYLAVSLFELGQKEAAALALNDALPRLERTPIVERYVSEILAGADRP